MWSREMQNAVCVFISCRSGQYADNVRALLLCFGDGCIVIWRALRCPKASYIPLRRLESSFTVSPWEKEQEGQSALLRFALYSKHTSELWHIMTEERRQIYLSSLPLRASVRFEARFLGLTVAHSSGQSQGTRRIPFDNRRISAESHQSHRGISASGCQLSNIRRLSAAARNQPLRQGSPRRVSGSQSEE